MNRRELLKQAAFFGTALSACSTGARTTQAGRPRPAPSTLRPPTNSRLPVIIEAAVNGSTPKARNPNVPRAPAAIATDALRCLRAGAAIIHNHNNDPNVGGATGRHDAAPYLQAWRVILAQRPDAILYPTMAGGGPHTTIAERAAHTVTLAEAGVARMAVVDTGSVDVGPSDADGLPAAVDSVYLNTFADVRYMFALCERYRLGPTIAVFEPGFLRVALAYARAGKMPRGALIKLFFGGERVHWGLPPTPASLEAYLSMLDGTDLPWSVAVPGGDVIGTGLARLALERGGHLRVGLEDYAGSGRPSNEDLVRDAVALAAVVGRPVASCDQAASMLGLPLAARK